MTINELRKKTAELSGSVSLPSGRNRWVFRYYTPDNKRVKLTFATEEEALEAKLNHHLSKKASGETGVLTAEQVRIATTIFAMCGDRDPIEAVRHGLDVKEGKVVFEEQAVPGTGPVPVSYTHLTLPTNREV